MNLGAGGIDRSGDVGDRVGIDPAREVKKHFRLVQSAHEFRCAHEVIVRQARFNTGILHDLVGSREFTHFPHQSVIPVEGHRDQQRHAMRLAQRAQRRNDKLWPIYTAQSSPSAPLLALPDLF